MRTPRRQGMQARASPAASLALKRMTSSRLRPGLPRAMHRVEFKSCSPSTLRWNAWRVNAAAAVASSPSAAVAMRRRALPEALRAAGRERVLRWLLRNCIGCRVHYSVFRRAGNTAIINSSCGRRRRVKAGACPLLREGRRVRRQRHTVSQAAAQAHIFQLMKPSIMNRH
jgi:hypothetical protein